MIKDNRSIIDKLWEEYPADMILIGDKRFSTLYPDLAVRLTWNYKQFRVLLEENEQ
jgi:hypothetical protein